MSSRLGLFEFQFPTFVISGGEHWIGLDWFCHVVFFSNPLTDPYMIGSAAMEFGLSKAKAPINAEYDIPIQPMYHQPEQRNR